MRSCEPSLCVMIVPRVLMRVIDTLDSVTRDTAVRRAPLRLVVGVGTEERDHVIKVIGVNAASSCVSSSDMTPVRSISRPRSLNAVRRRASRAGVAHKHLAQLRLDATNGAVPSREPLYMSASSSVRSPVRNAHVRRWHRYRPFTDGL